MPTAISPKPFGCWRRAISRTRSACERNALRMHADALAADPPLLYCSPRPSLACTRSASCARAGIGLGTIDAGPHVSRSALEGRRSGRTRLRAIPGVVDVLLCAPAGGARLLP